MKERLKKTISNQQFMIKILSVTVILTFLFTTLIAVIGNQQVKIPKNPLEVSAADSSNMQLSSHYKQEILEEELQTQIEEEEEENVEPDQEQEMEQDQNLNSQENPKEIDEVKQQEDTDSKNRDKNSADRSGVITNRDEVYEDSSNIEVKDPTVGDELKTNDYFTTTITDQEIVTDKQYSFKIQQKEHNYIAKRTDVFVNGVVEKFSGTVSLKDGENSIEIRVIYEDTDGDIFTVSRTYIVYLQQEELVIYSNLTDRLEVTQAILTFKASAEINGKNVPVQVYLNGEELSTTEAPSYEAHLKSGENEIVIAAEQKDQAAKQTYTIVYQQPITNLSIETDLKDQEISEPILSFSAIGKDGDEQVELRALLNDKKLSGENGQFHANLQEGSNTLQLTAQSGERTLTETYTIHYVIPANGGDGGEEVPNAPYIEVPDLTDGQTLKNAIHKFHVIARDYKGESLTGGRGSIVVTNNGEAVAQDWNDNSKVSFKLVTYNGPNHIVVTVTDPEGNKGIFELTVHGDVLDEGESIGNVTLSLEASTIGLGYLIAPQQVEIYQGENGAIVLDRLLKEHGFTYEHKGSHESGFYLSRVLKPGIVPAVNVPEELAVLVERDSERFSPDVFKTDSLGEFDVSNLSGWKYSVNGTYANVGFADYYFKDGDVVRIRFTLAYGADIGGGMPGASYHKEW